MFSKSFVFFLTCLCSPLAMNLAANLPRYKYIGNCELYADKTLPKKVCPLYNLSRCLDPMDVFSCEIYDARVRLVVLHLARFAPAC